MTRQVWVETTREAVLTAAAECFLQKGYAKASLSEIRDCVGVTKGVMYSHFSSKGALARSVIVEGHLRMLAASAPLRVASAPAVETLIGACRVVLDLGVSDPVVAAMQRLYWEVGGDHGADGNFLAVWHEVVDELVERAARAGDLTVEDPAEVTVLVVNSLMGIWLEVQVTGTVEQLPRRVERFWYHLLPSLTTPEQAHYFRQYAARRLLR